MGFKWIAHQPPRSRQWPHRRSPIEPRRQPPTQLRHPHRRHHPNRRQPQRTPTPLRTTPQPRQNQTRSRPGPQTAHLRPHLDPPPTPPHHTPPRPQLDIEARLDTVEQIGRRRGLAARRRSGSARRIGLVEHMRNHGLGSGLGGRGVVVTGAVGGVGWPTGQAFASAGARVVAVDLRRSAADEVVAGLGGNGHMAVGMDLTDLDAHKALVDRAVDGLGDLFVLAHLAVDDRRHAAGARRRIRGDRRGRGLRGRQARWVSQRRSPQRQRRPTGVLSVGTRRRRRVSRASQTPGADRCSGESDPPPSGNPNSMSVIAAKAAIRVYAGPDGTIGASLVVAAGAGPRLEPEPECTLRGVQRQARSVTGRTSRNAEQGWRHLSRHPGMTSVTSVRCAVGPAPSLHTDRPLTCGFGGTPEPDPARNL